MDFKQARDQYGAIYFHDDDLVDAGWEPGFELRVPDDLASGIYAARLRTADHEDYAPFFVRPPRGTTTARIAFLVPTFSYLAYARTGREGEGQLSLYSTHADGSGITYSSALRPITNMRPKITTRNPWQFMADTHLIDWFDAKGFAVDIITDHDLHLEGLSLVERYNVVLTGTHPEYTSTEMLDALEAYLSGGGRLMYMGGNGFYWITSLDPTGRYIEVRRAHGTEAWQGAAGEHYHATTGEFGGLWRFRGRAPQRLVGTGFTAQGFDRNSPFRRMPGSFDPRAAFIFEGLDENALIGEHPSLVLEVGAAGSELDRVDYALGSPAHTLVLARSFRALGRVPARRRGGQHVGLAAGRHRERPRLCRHGVHGVPERRGGVLHELHRLERQPLLQRLRQRRVADHRERPAAFRRRRADPVARGRERRSVARGCDFEAASVERRSRASPAGIWLRSGLSSSSS